MLPNRIFAHWTHCCIRMYLNSPVAVKRVKDQSTKLPKLRPSLLSYSRFKYLIGRF